MRWLVKAKERFCHRMNGDGLQISPLEGKPTPRPRPVLRATRPEPHGVSPKPSLK